MALSTAPSASRARPCDEAAAPCTSSRDFPTFPPRASSAPSAAPLHDENPGVTHAPPVIALAPHPALALSTPAAAGPISYTFSGSGDAQLTGGFVLDDGAAWSVDSNPGGVTGVLSSPIQQLWGTYGAYSFQGLASLHVLDRPEFGSDGSDTPGSDYWIIRAALSGPAQTILPQWP